MFQPSYLKLFNNGELEKRVETLKTMLRNCVLCPHQCEVNRLEGETGYCKTLDKAIVHGADPHFGEEPELVGRYGSGAIFFSNCNLKCVFCQNYEISHCGIGQEVDSQELAQIMLSLQEDKCHNINLVSPGHIVPQIVEAIFLAVKKGLSIPIIYNTNGYDLTDTLKYLDGIIDIYMPDIKFASDEVGLKYLGVKNYYSIATSAIKEMFKQVGNLKTDSRNIAYRGLLIRHLIMPENLAGSDKIFRYIAEEVSKDVYINIMAQYYPAHEASKYEELNKRITLDEYKEAINSAKENGLKRINISEI